MRIFESVGLEVDGFNAVIDPHKKPTSDNIILSHAHSDHVKLNKTSNFFCSAQTMDLISARYSPDFSCSPLPFNKSHSLGDSSDVSFSFVNSGHILGSSQVVIDHPEAKVVCTSDFKLDSSLISSSAEIVDSDILIIETTFGLPSYSFPSRDVLYPQIGSWIKKHSKIGFVVLAGYSLGKAQELTAICNEFADVVPIVHDSIFSMNEVYKSHNIKIGDYIKLNHNLNESNVLIMPPSLCDRFLFSTLEHYTKKKVFSAFATGWNYRRNFDQIFPLSDHADYNGLCSYVEQSSPKLVLTTHGFEKEFAKHITSKFGIPARPLNSEYQFSMLDF